MTKAFKITLGKMKEIKELNNSWFLLKKSLKSVRKYGLIGAFSNFKNKLSLCSRPDGNLDLFKTVPPSFDFPKPAEHPEVSIIIPVYNQLNYTIKCLYAILQNTSGVTYEVILADDNSSDNTRAIEETIKNIIYIRNESNLGFLKNCNNAVKYCKGHYILFLNNDTIPQQGWLKPLVDFMENDKLIGGVGSKLVFPNGTMQEAGSIIWNDGSCLGYGRGDDHNKPEYSFAREVDYCSGASIMFRREQFIELGQFDEIYAPAYYEEADFCMTLRKNGYKVMLIPQSVVVHSEFISSTQSKGIELQRRNRKFFVNKWHDELTTHYPPLESNIIHGRSRSGKRHVMIIDDIIPDASLGSGFPRSGHMLDILCEIMDITYCQTDPNRVLDQGLINKYQRAGVEIFAINYFNQTGHIENILQARKRYYDFIFVSRDHNMALFNKIPAEIYKGAKVIYDAEAITACRNIMFGELAGISVSPEEADNLISKEVSLALKADVVMAVSETERQIFQRYGCKNTYVLGHAMAVSPGHTAFADRNGLLFVGRIEEDAENPNFDSLIYFINNIFDRILKVIPSLQLHIVGLCLAPTLEEINRKNIILHGRVADTKPFYDQCRVFIAPTRFAAGIPLKLNEAAANGIPSVATPLLARQLGWSNGTELLTAATAEEFADSVIRLYNDPDLWLTVRNNSIKRVMHDCSPQLFRNTVLNIVASSIKSINIE